jgi:hypothetical protein
MKIALFGMTEEGDWVPWQVIPADELLSIAGVARLADEAHEAGFLGVRIGPLIPTEPSADVSHGARRPRRPTALRRRRP